MLQKHVLVSYIDVEQQISIIGTLKIECVKKKSSMDRLNEMIPLELSLIATGHAEYVPGTASHGNQLNPYKCKFNKLIYEITMAAHGSSTDSQESLDISRHENDSPPSFLPTLDKDYNLIGHLKANKTKFSWLGSFEQLLLQSRSGRNDTCFWAPDFLLRFNFY